MVSTQHVTTNLHSGADATGGSLPSLGRGLAAAGVLLSGDVHLVLYFDGFSDIKVIGPAFMLNAIGGIVIGLAVLLWRHWLPLLAAIAFGIATLAAYYISATVGLFGVHETLGGNQVILAEIAEWVAIAGGLLALLAGRRKA
jgi:hypothetical protein